MDYAQLIEKLARLGRPRVVLVGDFMLDEYIYGDVERINPEAPVPVLRVVRSEQRLGGAGRVAADLAALGAETACVGLVGDDAAGAALRGQLAAAGCPPDSLVAAAGRTTTCKTRLVGLAQHRHRQQLIRMDREQTGAPDEATSRRLFDSAAAALDGADALLLQDYNKGVLAGGLIGSLAAEARRRNIPVLVDPALVTDYARYRGATLITPNRYEASRASGCDLAELPAADDGSVDLAPLAEAAGRLIASADLDYVVITLDRQGAYLAGRDGRGELIGTRPRAIYDVTGAGDMVLAVLGLCWGRGFEPAEATALANLAAGLEVERFGSVPIGRDELAAELHAAVRGASKLWDVGPLAGELARRRAAGQRIVFTNGCFDILHAGHVQYLQFARAQGDLLVVGLNSDASVRRNKGPDRPIHDQAERSAVLSGLGCVDYVAVFDEDTPLALVRAVQPDVLVKGREWAGNVVGTDVVEGRGGKVVLADMLDGHSTTGTIERIRQADAAGGKEAGR